MQNLSESMSSTSCRTDNGELDSCRDEPAALILKIVAIASILIAGVCGVAIPLVGKKRRFLGTDSNVFVAAKAFAGGVILATGFVHMLPDATSALSDSCLPKIPWSKFPFSGFIAMMAALVTLLIEFIGTQYYERKQERQNQTAHIDSMEFASESGIVPEENKGLNGKVFGEEEGGVMHIVGMHAHAAHHRHSHSHREGACAGRLTHSHAHSDLHSSDGIEDEESGKRHVVVSQVIPDCFHKHLPLSMSTIIHITFLLSSKSSNPYFSSPCLYSVAYLW